MDAPYQNYNLNTYAVWRSTFRCMATFINAIDLYAQLFCVVVVLLPFYKAYTYFTMYLCHFMLNCH